MYNQKYIKTLPTKAEDEASYIKRFSIECYAQDDYIKPSKTFAALIFVSCLVISLLICL